MSDNQNQKVSSRAPNTNADKIKHKQKGYLVLKTSPRGTDDISDIRGTIVYLRLAYICFQDETSRYNYSNADKKLI